MIVKKVEIEKFRAFNDTSFKLGKYVTAIAGRNATQKTTVLGLIGQPFTLSQKDNPLFGQRTLDGYDFKSQFSEKFKFSDKEQAGEHKWTLHFYDDIYIYNGSSKSYFTSETIVRERKTGKLRIWNAEDKARKAGGGYVQAPVYYLSLSRLFPIGETVGQTKLVDLQLTQQEQEYCLKHYRNILRIHDDYRFIPQFGLEEKTTKQKFVGITDDKHDIKTNSAGEGNISRIILAMLSFARLHNQRKTNGYKGGILLIDELDAAVYPRSQKEIVGYLRKEAQNYNVQVVFTTHSPIVLQAVNELQLEERKLIKGIKSENIAYNNTIVYLEPNPDPPVAGSIKATNINSARGLRRCLDNMDFKPTISDPQMRVYCEDDVATNFLRYLLAEYIDEVDSYFDFQDIDLSWTQYVTLLEKNAFKVKDSLIMLDADVPTMKEYHNHKRLIENSENTVILPLLVEEGLFRLLKDRSRYSVFYREFLRDKNFTYEICFNEWLENPDYYRAKDKFQFKRWYRYVEPLVSADSLFGFWLSLNREDAGKFIIRFCDAYNKLADRLKLDPLSLPQELDNSINEENE